jgi:hypothetical protein
MNTSFDQTTNEQSCESDTDRNSDYHLDLTRKEFEKEAEIIDAPPESAHKIIEPFELEEPTHGKEDPGEPEDEKGLSSFWHAFINLWKGTITLGILTLPYDFNEIGGLSGTISVLIVAFISLYCYNLYVKVLDSFPEPRLTFTQFIDNTTEGAPNYIIKSCLVLAIWGIVIPHLLFLKELMN